MAVEEEPKTRELKVDQAARERAELEQAERTDDPEDTATHERRAERAGYLRDKLEERARVEREEG